MPKKETNEPRLTKRQASVINKGNRNISGNINALLDNMSIMTYGIQRTDKTQALADEFNSLLKGELDSISKTAEGDTTSFITKLFSENNKKLANAVKSIEDIFNVNEGQMEAYLSDQYRNRLIKQADLHEVASQLVELQEAITVTRDAIIATDVVDGHMCRNITYDSDSVEGDTGEDYTPIIEKMEEKFDLQKKIKNFIIPYALEYGEYNVYCVPYEVIFNDFMKEKNSNFGGNRYHAYSITESTLYDYVIGKGKDKYTDMEKVITESAYEIVDKDLVEGKTKSNVMKEMSEELKAYMKNITICNEAVPLPILEEGVESFRYYFNEYVYENMTMTEEKKDGEFTFDHIMKGIDDGVHIANNNHSEKKTTSKKNIFSNMKDCYIKMIDPMRLLPIELMNEVIGYYYIQEDDINPMSGILSSTVYYARYDENDTEHSVLSTLSDAIVDAFDKPFLEKNIKFKKLIVEALNYYKLTNKKVKFQFIPKEYMINFKVNEDINGHGVSIIEPSLFYAKLYLMLLLFKMMTIIMNSNDTKVNYIRQSGIDQNVANKIQDIIRKKQQRQITMTDMFSYTTLVNKIGQGAEMYIPVGSGNERGIETEILAGQEVQLNTDLMELLKKAYISGTGVPDVLLNYLHEAEFAKTLELANTRFHGRVVSFQLDFNRQITEMYRKIAKFTTVIPPEVINSMEFSFIQPKYSNSNITNDLLQNHNSLQDFLTAILFGDDLNDPKTAEAVKVFKRNLAEDRLPVINFTRMEELYKDAVLQATKVVLDPDKENDNDQQ